MKHQNALIKGAAALLIVCSISGCYRRVEKVTVAEPTTKEVVVERAPATSHHERTVVDPSGRVLEHHERTTTSTR